MKRPMEKWEPLEKVYKGDKWNGNRKPIRKY